MIEEDIKSLQRRLEEVVINNDERLCDLESDQAKMAKAVAALTKRVENNGLRLSATQGQVAAMAARPLPAAEREPGEGDQKCRTCGHRRDCHHEVHIGFGEYVYRECMVMTRHVLCPCAEFVPAESDPPATASGVDPSTICANRNCGHLDDFHIGDGGSSCIYRGCDCKEFAYRKDPPPNPEPDDRAMFIALLRILNDRQWSPAIDERERYESRLRALAASAPVVAGGGDVSDLPTAIAAVYRSVPPGFSKSPGGLSWHLEWAFRVATAQGQAHEHEIRTQLQTIGKSS